MDDLDYWQRTQVGDEPENDDYYSENSASTTAALDLITARYDALLAEHEKKRQLHFDSTLDSRGSHVEHVSQQRTREIEIPDIGAHNRSVPDIKELIEQKKSEFGLDETDETDTPEPEIPILEDIGSDL
jgi:hypothetical protein